MTDRKVMQQALDAFCKIAHVMGRYDLPGYHNYLVVIANQQADALREAIAQPEQATPVGWLHTTGMFESYWGAHMDDDWTPLYAPPSRSQRTSHD